MPLLLNWALVNGGGCFFKKLVTAAAWYAGMLCEEQVRICALRFNGIDRREDVGEATAGEDDLLARAFGVIDGAAWVDLCRAHGGEEWACHLLCTVSASAQTFIQLLCTHWETGAEHGAVFDGLV